MIDLFVDIKIGKIPDFWNFSNFKKTYAFLNIRIFVGMFVTWPTEFFFISTCMFYLHKLIHSPMWEKCEEKRKNETAGGREYDWSRYMWSQMFCIFNDAFFLRIMKEWTGDREWDMLFSVFINCVQMTKCLYRQLANVNAQIVPIHKCTHKNKIRTFFALQMSNTVVIRREKNPSHFIGFSSLNEISERNKIPIKRNLFH